MPTSLSTALYTRRKKNRRRNMPNVEKAETTSATVVRLIFNQDITATNYNLGWNFIIQKKDNAVVGATPVGNDAVDFTITNPIANGDPIWFSYKREDGNYLGQRGEIMQSYTGYVSNLV